MDKSLSASDRAVVPQRAADRSLALDILRAVACCLVIGSHLEIQTSPSSLLAAWNRGGWIGVDLFFVLSGFLVSGILFREYQLRGTIDLRRFLVRRALRIYPAFYLFLLLTSVTIAIFAKNYTMIGPGRLLPECFFLQNYIPGTWGHTWSLAVEEHFYIGIAILIFALIGLRCDLRRWWIPMIFVCTAAAALAFRISRESDPHYQTRGQLLFPTHLRMDSLGFGVLLSYLWNFHGQRLRRICHPLRWLLLASGCLLLLPAFIWPQSTPAVLTVGLTGFYLGAGAILLSLSLGRIPVNFLTSGLGLVGTRSYSIYLWHAPVVTWVMPKAGPYLNSVHAMVVVIVALAICVAIGFLMAWIVEVPVLRFRERFFPSREHDLTAES